MVAFTILKVLVKKLLRRKLQSTLESHINEKLTGATKSKTSWFGFFLILFSALEAQTGIVRSITPDAYEPLVLGAVGFIVICLRWVTTRSLEER